MTFGVNHEHVSYQMRTVQGQVARCQGRSSRQDVAGGRTRARGHLPRLRSRVGFTLVAAGLRLLPVEGSHQHG
ncbi:MAG TPA: hypothetical protein VGI74_19055 [Streptosporangiaceae bacterium]|jgi:hypothetical protein